LAQATVEHKKNKTNQSSAALRDAALKVRDAKSIADARKGLQQVKLAWKGDTSGASNLKYAWDKLISRGALMAELETRQIKLRRIVKRPRKPASDSLHATTGAVLALALSADTSGAESKSDIAEWKALAKQYQTTMTELIGALKKKDSKASRALHTAGQLTCTKCHQKYEVE
jgi:cytochrome c556